VVSEPLFFTLHDMVQTLVLHLTITHCGLSDFDVESGCLLPGRIQGVPLMVPQQAMNMKATFMRVLFKLLLLLAPIRGSWQSASVAAPALTLTSALHVHRVMHVHWLTFRIEVECRQTT